MTGSIRRLLAVFGVLMFVLVACGDGATTDDNTPDAGDTGAQGGTEGEGTDDVISVGITQFATIPPLDGLREEFNAAMDEHYGEDGWTSEYLPAEGDVGNTSAIARQLASGDHDVFLCIATASCQALANEVSDRPIVFGAVADPAGAGIREDDGGDEGNATGVSSLGPIEEQMQLIIDSMPDVQTFGFIYNDAEQNAIFQTDVAEEAVNELGDYAVARQTAATSGEVSQAAQQLASEADVMWFPASSTALEGLPALFQVSEETGVPVFCADTTAVQNEDGRPRGCLGTVGFSFPESGRIAAELVIRIVDEGETPGSIPTVYVESSTMPVNTCAAEQIGFEFPQSVLDEATEVITCE